LKWFKTLRILHPEKRILRLSPTRHPNGHVNAFCIAGCTVAQWIHLQPAVHIGDVKSIGGERVWKMDSPTGLSILLPRCPYRLPCCPFGFPPCRFFSAAVQSKARAQLQNELHEPAGVRHQVPDGLVCVEPCCPHCPPGRRRLIEDRPPGYQLRRGVRGGCAVVGRSSPGARE
jgi:hypothetical protein